MWQANARYVTTGSARDSKQGLVFRCLSLFAMRYRVGLLFIVVGAVHTGGVHTGTAHASDGVINPGAGPDAIYNESSIQNRVYGGGNAEPGAWPSMAAIVSTGSFPLEDRFFCGGSVIGDRWILTAAHCMFDPFGAQTQPSEIRVVVGIDDLQDGTATEAVVTNIFIHPQYNGAFGILRNDIALLELANVVSAPRTTLFAGDPESVSDSMGFIAGWGATGVDPVNGSEIYPNLLQDASVPLVPLQSCNSPESYQGNISNTQVCAGFSTGGVDSCVGDSGGPLYLIQNGEQVQVGITSFGNGCGLPNFYGVYTNISSFRTWIASFIIVADSNTTNGFVAVDGADSGSGDVGGASSGKVSVGARRKGGSLNLVSLWLLLGALYLRRTGASLNSFLKACDKYK